MPPTPARLICALAAAGLLLVVACSSDRGSASPRMDTTAQASTAVRRDSVPYELAWLAGGTVDERFFKVARHFRGLDQAMIEIGYRYEELYWAGRDGNWPFAAYQLQKIRLTLANAVERRPRRAASASMLDAALEALEQAGTRKDTAVFAAGFRALTATCNSCHAAEKVEFMRVAQPSERPSVIRAPAVTTPPR